MNIRAVRGIFDHQPAVIMLRRRAVTFAIVYVTLATRAVGDSQRERSQARSPSGGAVVTYRAGSAASDTAVLPEPALDVAAGTPPAPFLPPGPFTADIEGQLSVDLRDDYQSRAELSGSARIMIGEAVVLSASGSARGHRSEQPRA